MHSRIMNGQAAIQKLLQTRFADGQRRNPRFSIRAFSKKVGVHFAALSAIMNGKRVISRKLASRIADRLYLDPQERSELLEHFPEKLPPLGTTNAPKYLELSMKQFKIAAEWEHFAVLNLFQCSEYESSTKWIASRLRITESRTRQVVERLLELELLSLDKDGNLKRSDKNYRTPDDYADISLKKMHEQGLELAKDSLYRDSIDQRDFTTVTVAVNPKNIRTAKEMIRKFQDDLCDQLEKGKRTEVYRLSVQLFPLTELDTPGVTKK